MSNIYPLLPRLVVNSRFIDEFISAEAPCFALGLVEERKQTCGFLALRPKIVIPEAGPVEQPPKVFVLAMFLHELNRNRLFLMNQLAWTRGANILFSYGLVHFTN